MVQIGHKERLVIKQEWFFRKEQRAYQCSVCDSGFTDRSNYLAHMRRHQSTPFVCKVCGKVFTGQNNLADHMGLHDKPPLSKYAGLLNGCPSYGNLFKDLLRHLRMQHNMSTITQYKRQICHQLETSACSECMCEDHYKWIVKYVGPVHNCYFCDC
jgi:uncharacterized Zn-finger protein